MSEINANWDLWITKSIFKHLSSVAPKSFFEGENRLTNRELEYVEVRTTGPDYTTISRGNVHIEVYVNCVVNVVGSSNLYRIRELAGLVASKMESIPITVDSTVVGCLSPIGNVITRHLGMVYPSTKLNRAIIDAAFEMEF